MLRSRYATRSVVRSFTPKFADRLVILATVSLLLPPVSRECHAGVIFNTVSLASLAGGSRWDAAPRTMSVGGGNSVERSLSGGLRYSLQGGSYEAYRNQFTWSGGTPPAVADFQAAIQKAFNAWTVADPVTGLTTSLQFTPDLGTPVSTMTTASGVRLGAEIDLFAATSASSWTVGDNGTRAEAFFNAVSVSGLTLTSGTTNYAGSAISGADITFNNNPGAVYTLDIFQTILTHEIGHAIGLGDVDFPSGNSIWIDDNYDPSTSATALATLTNSWALLVNPLNPANSPELEIYNPANGDPGVDTEGVDILMESHIPSSLFGLDFPLQNDDFGMRQFLYPSLAPIPEPATTGLFAAAVTTSWFGYRRARRTS
jgi:hypothetical protein